MRTASIIGVDIGGTKCALGLYDSRTMKRLKGMEFPTRGSRGFPKVLDDILAALRELRLSGTSKIGIAVPGLVNRTKGTIIHLPNIPGGEGFPLKRTIVRALKIQTTIGNDSQGFTLAEALYGAGKKHHVVVGITMGTGVGGGIVINGKLFGGEHGNAGELGHMLLRPGEPPFKSLNMRGEVEQFLSGTALQKRGKTTVDIPELAWFIATLTHCIDPSIIIFGGGVGRSLKPSLANLKAELPRWLLPGTPLPRLAIRHLSDAATRGAALIAKLSV